MSTTDQNTRPGKPAGQRERAEEPQTGSAMSRCRINRGNHRADRRKPSLRPTPLRSSPRRSRRAAAADAARSARGPATPNRSAFRPSRGLWRLHKKSLEETRSSSRNSRRGVARQGDAAARPNLPGKLTRPSWTRRKRFAACTASSPNSPGAAERPREQDEAGAG